jgi:hypothetical protein
MTADHLDVAVTLTNARLQFTSALRSQQAPVCSSLQGEV